ncbi:Ferredoxin-2 [Mycobacteroides franklinii]|uniref:Ferredoxin n=1 Tax=Mycobacteroides franklinii TaxID=948102 RepID=A0A4R8RAJ5_9MYCO|nr:ferredoxin [Mycobacteroides franklinii]TDZ46759.1 Ferredoxin-2 [Mycobacteroides franklinii]TDZ53376.1 Ferredoxin-2 [Mycobacteroides franklinii]TDZ60476.1 Ferredoxin-2 [Mycobacteroides franklinii]TDZ61572.1 Ferredoxin-2 [Mycobacteroides franklinii]TDZ74045.1 Ferredoxin-2 [Mycobacteroides franklinii]
MSLREGGLIVTVDQDLCMGSGYCVVQQPDLFGADADGTAVPLLTATLSEAQAQGAAAAARICPAGAIEVHDTSL